MQHTLLTVQNLTVRYKTQDAPVIRDISFTIAPGERIALIGANGAGKTTLMLACVGILPHIGDILLENIKLTRKSESELRQQIGFVFQEPDDQLFSPSLRDDLAFGLENMKMPPQEIQERVEYWLKKFELLPYADRSAHALSGGEKRMAALATVLCMSPKLLLLDEPTAFLDARARRKLEHTLNTLSQACMISTHDIGFASRVCQRAILLRDGQIAAQGPCQTLFHDHALMESCGADSLT